MENETDTILQKKSQTRKHFTSLLKAYGTSITKKIESSNNATNIFLESNIYRNATTILTYLATDIEIDTRKIIEISLANEKSVAIPQTNTSDFSLTFHYLEKDKPLQNQTKKQSFGIYEPLSFLPTVDIKKLPSNTVILIPGVAFTRNGERIGHGFGYYDRFLQKLYEQTSIIHLPEALVGFCYSFQLTDSIPIEKHDIPLTHILTEIELITCTTKL